MKSKLLYVLIGFLTFASAVGFAGEPEDAADANARKGKDWYATVLLNGWLAGMSGQVKTPTRQADVDISFGDILEDLDGGLIGRVEGGWKNVAFMIDGTYMKTVSRSMRDLPGPFFTQDQVTTKQTLLDFGGYYLIGQRPLMQDGWHFGVEPFLGGRYIGIDVDAFHTGPLATLTAGLDKDIVVPLVGMRLSGDLIGNLFVQMEGAVGGFGAYNCDLTWTGSGMVGYGFFKTFILAAGYKAVGIDFNSDFSDGLVGLDVIYHGPVVSLGVHF